MGCGGFENDVCWHCPERNTNEGGGVLSKGKVTHGPSSPTDTQKSRGLCGEQPRSTGNSVVLGTAGQVSSTFEKHTDGQLLRASWLKKEKNDNFERLGPVIDPAREVIWQEGADVHRGAPLPFAAGQKAQIYWQRNNGITCHVRCHLLPWVGRSEKQCHRLPEDGGLACLAV